RNGNVTRQDAGGEDEEGDDEVREQESADQRDKVRQEIAHAPAPCHAILRSRAANAPSVPCRCGSTRNRPASSTAAGTVPSGGGSSRHSRCSPRKRSTCSSFSSVSREHVLYTSSPPGATIFAARLR